MRKPILIAAALMALAPAIVPVAASAGGPGGCPPGLAKKHNGCLPPGHARQGHGPGPVYDDRPTYRVEHVYRRGERLPDNYIVIVDPGRYGLDPYQSYYRFGDYVYRVDRNTREVLDLIGAVAAILN
ncbi:MAG: excinuclease ABC subunit A [Pseudodonghicola sp.]